jgi:Protein of unknown function (DUF3313)
MHRDFDEASPIRRAVGPALALGAMLALPGCGSTPVAYQELGSAAQLRPAREAEKPFQYRGTSDLAGYSKLMIDPVTIYTGPDAQFGSVSPDDRKIVADYMTRKFTEVLGKRYELTNEPAPGTARLHLTLTGIETSTPVLSTVSHVAPVAVVVNTALEATDHNGTFFGSVSYAVELSDAVGGDLLYAYVTRQTPDALDVTASVGYLDAAKTGIRIGARHLVADLQRLSPRDISSMAHE